MYKLKNKFNDFVVWISEKGSFLGDQYFNGNSLSNDPHFKKPKVHLISLFIFQILLSMPLAGATAHIS